MTPMRLITSLCAILLFWLPAYGDELLRGQIYAGGVAGATDLLIAENSDDYRGSGGGLYLHNSAWGKLTIAQRRKILNVFHNTPIGIEIGNSPVNWPEWLKGAYVDLGIKPHFVTVNVFADKHIPTVAEWKKIHTGLRAVLPNESLVIPTFEFPNFGDHKHRLVSDRVSRSTTFQQIIALSGGFSLDIPPAEYFRREDNYRLWVIDALAYSNRHKYMSVLIISPDNSGSKFLDHTSEFLKILRQYKALPTILVFENYIDTGSYPNPVGSEDQPNTILGTANRTIRSTVPKYLTKPSRLVKSP